MRGIFSAEGSDFKYRFTDFVLCSCYCSDLPVDAIGNEEVTSDTDDDESSSKVVTAVDCSDATISDVSSCV